MKFVLRLVIRYFIWSFLVHHTHRTNATFFRAATQQMHAKEQRPIAWHWWPGYVRFLVKLGIFLSCTAGPILYFFFPVTFWWTVAVLVALLVLDGAVVGYRRFRHYRHTSTYVQPLADALGPRLGIGECDPGEWLTVPLDFSTAEEAAVVVQLPKEFAATKDTRDLVTGIVTSKLGMVDVDADYQMVGRPRAVFTKAPRPPAMVKFADVRAEIDACQPGDVVIGLDRRHNVFRGSFNIADPHWGASVGSNRGKSTFLQLVAAQILHQDTAATVTAIDPKMVSLEPLVGIPGVVVANDPRNVQGMWDAVFDFRAEMDRRMDTLSVDPTATFPFALLIIDELNQFSAMSAAYWREVKEKGDQATPPVWGHIAAILWQGRQLRCHVIMVGQRLDDRATGGIGLRDSLGFRALGGFTPQQWAMLVGTTPIPRSQKPRGRWIYSDGESLTWVQNVYASPAEVRDYAMENRRPGIVTGAAGGPLRVIDGGGATPPGQVPSNAPLAAETAPVAPGAGSPWVVGLYAGAEYLDVTARAFRRRRDRLADGIPGEVRQGNQPAWTEADLDAWQATWPHAVEESATVSDLVGRHS